MNRIISYCMVIVAVLLAFSNGSAAAQPDIVIFMTDQQNFRAMSCAGTSGIDTPTMDGLAKEGVRFTHAFCATPQCSPARAATWTGLYPHRTGVMGNVHSPKQATPAGQSPSMDHNVTSIGKIFTAAGYETVYFGKWHLGGNLGKHGFKVHDTKQARGRPLSQRAVDYLRKRSARSIALRPLLMVVSYINPHDIYYLERQSDIKIRSQIRLPLSMADDLLTKPLPQSTYRDRDQGVQQRNYTGEDWQRYLSYYHQLTEGVDAEIGMVLKEVRQHCSDLLTVFVSDHGDLAGAHGVGFKGPMMYEELVRVPMIVNWPGKIEPSVCGELVGQIDILPTLCDLADVKSPKNMDGKSLRPLLFDRTSSKPAWRDAVFCEYYGKQDWRVPIRMVRTKRHKYVRYLKFGEELYDLLKDPHEQTNLARAAEYVSVRKQLSEKLDRWIVQTQDPFNRLTVVEKKGTNTRSILFLH